MFAKIVKKFSVSLKTFGIRRTLFWIYFGYLKINTFFLYKKDLREETLSLAVPSNVSIEKIPIDKLRLLRESERHLPIEFYYDLIDGVETCFIAYIDNQPAHIMWIYFKANPSRFFSLDDGEAEIGYMVTLPQFQRMGINPIVITNAFRWLKENGYGKIYISTHRDNVAAIKSIERSGFKRIGEVKYYGLLSFLEKMFKG